jgi:Ice-binding-like/Bacterial Ig domain
MTHQVNPSQSQPAGKRRRRHRRACAASLLLGALLVTAALASSAQAASVPLGTVESFAVLGGTTVTNTGPSVISGDLGVSPGTAVTGFPPGTVTGGTIHAADGVALQAEAALATAYNDAAGRSSTAAISADLAGRTLTPGVYTSATSLGLSGDLTLDGQGDPSAVFVFQAGSTLTVGSGSHVLLIGGAQACNVFWQVGSSATIGTGSAFVGNILALTSISLTTGATLNGRALARNGAVTLDTNTITKAACATQTPSSVTAPPSVTDVSATTGAGQRVTIKLHGTDVAGARLTYAITKRPRHGTLGPINQGTGRVTYTPRRGFTGRDRFTYRVTSSNGTSNTATVTITIKRRRAHQHTPPQPARNEKPGFTG